MINEWEDKTSQQHETELTLDDKFPLPKSYVIGSDLFDEGFEDFLTISGPEKSMSSTVAFVTGKAPLEPEASGHTRLDVTKDRVQPPEVKVSMDSVIWLTRRLKVNAAFNMHTSPYRKENPPIYTTNHVFVELLFPRQQEDKDSGRISNGVKQIPLANLPNTHFGALERIEGAPSIAVVFPRMKHRHPLVPYWETRLTEEVELLWLRNIVYVALNRLSGVGTKPYLDYSYDDTKWKHAGTMETTQPLTPDHLDELQDHIDQILQDNQGDPYHDCFQSYFGPSCSKYAGSK